MKRRSYDTPRSGANRALALFKRAAREVPAYANFLKKHKIRADAIATVNDFARLPVTTKENYIASYSLADRSWGGTLAEHKLFAVSSGTSGTPAIWPRGIPQEDEALRIHDMLFCDLFSIQWMSTLIVIGFPMGIYVSGIATVLPTFASVRRHPCVAMAAPGNNKESFLKIVEALRGQFAQMIFVGHPFFIKDIIETLKREKINLKRTRIRALFCSEGFSESWRNYLAQHVDKASPIADFFNTYGSSEFLLVGLENPHTVLLRRLAERDAGVRTALFGTDIIPQVFQYDPRIRYIEKGGNDLLITAASGIPLIRFNQHDVGDVFSYARARIAVGKYHAAFSAELADIHWREWRLPFVTLYGRSDRTMIFYAANIYPEHIMLALSKPRFLAKLTGKFTMEKTYMRNMDQILNIRIELKPGVKKSPMLAAYIQTQIVQTLERINMEYAFLRKNLPKDIMPRIDLRPYQDAVYFRPGLKPRFIAAPS